MNELSELLEAITNAGLGYELETLSGTVKDGVDGRCFSLRLESKDYKITVDGGKEDLLSTVPMLMGSLLADDEDLPDES